MACRPIDTKPYLNQCWFIVYWTHTNKLQWNFNPNSNFFIEEIAFWNIVCKMGAICPDPYVLTPNSRPVLNRNSVDQVLWRVDIRDSMMTSSDGNIFRVTGHLCGEFTGPGALMFPSKQSWGWWFDTPSRPLWRHCHIIAKTVSRLMTLIFIKLQLA